MNIRKIVLFFLIINQTNLIWGQFDSIHEKYWDDTSRMYYGYIANGKVFTPKDTLRALIVFVSYGEPYDSQEVAHWPSNSDFPDWANNASEKPFYSTFLEFPDNNNVYSDTNRMSVSNFYFQMSHGSFKLIADYYPKRVIVNVDKNDQWGDINRKALQQIYDSVEWGRYDNRTNSPAFDYDNTTSQPDKIIDYVIFCHRFSWNDDFNKPSTKLTNKWASGVSTTIVDSMDVGDGYSVTKDGFTFFTGGENIISTFTHELGHELYTGPHYSGGNGVVGKFFYLPIAGWGMMHLDYNYACATGWERYILDWTPQIMANNQVSDIENGSDLSINSGIFTLRDFITTGDVIRIRVPAGDTNYQYLWLENHQCLSTFDGNLRGNHFCDSPIDEYKQGLVAYVEIYSRVKVQNRFNLYKEGNGIRWLSRMGDYDFIYGDTIHPAAICSNPTFHFYRKMQNVLGGQNVGELIRGDFDGNGNILYNVGIAPDNNAGNETEELIQVDQEAPTAKYYTGTGMQFQKGDKVGIARNPCVKNIPQYNSTTCVMGDYYLNGISFEILDQYPDGSMRVKVRLDDVDIDKDVRWAAGSIVLTDITGDSRPDVNIMPGIKIDIDKSGTPNRHKNPANPGHTPSTIDDFVTSTTFTCRNGSYFKQEEGSMVNVKNNSTLVIEDGATYEINDRAVLNVEASGTLVVRSGATLRVKGAGHVEVKDGAYLCIESGANILLDDVLSMINLRPGSDMGINPAGSSGLTCNCALQGNIHVVGNGLVNNDFADDLCIQNKVFSHDVYLSGDHIIGGYDVCIDPHGPVLVTNGARVIFDGENGTYLKNGFRVDLGSSLEVR